jgi:maltokinase
MDEGNESHTALDLPKGFSWTDSSIRIALEGYLAAFLAQARWFPVKAASKIAPSIVSILPFSGTGPDAIFLAIVETSQNDWYALPLRAEWLAGSEKPQKHVIAHLRQGGDKGVLRDVAADPDFIRRLLQHLRHGSAIDAGDWRLVFEPASAMVGYPHDAPVRIRPVEGEQSNSTALVDQTCVVKLYRHIEPGRNPEIEMGRFLTDEAGFAYTPALLGHVEAIHSNKIHAFAIIHAYVPNRGDAWTFSADRIKIYLDAISGGSDARDTALTVRREYLQWVRRMGRRVAEMHLALASREDVAAFKPEPVAKRDVAFWQDNLLRRASRIFDELEQRQMSPDIDRSLVEQFLGCRRDLAQITEKYVRVSLGRCQIRQHGDLHLGQILVAEDDAVIIDFEGEPKRPLDERRRRAPAARDVAGIIRSLDYAAMAASLGNTESEELSPLSFKALMTWRDQSTETFLGSYRETIGLSVLWPDNAEDADAMLNFFLLEKALYEVEYELAYRPGWLAVPLQGVMQLLSKP